MTILKQQKYLHRWKFEYKNGSTKFGMWSNSGPNGDPHTKAWCNNKDISYAIIERKELSGAVREIVRCSHDRFLNFQWMAQALPDVFSITGSKIPFTVYKGLRMVTTEGSVECLDDGSVKTRPNESDNINFATYGK